MMEIIQTPPEVVPPSANRPRPGKWDYFLLIFSILAVLVLMGRGLFLTLRAFGVFGAAVSADQMTDAYGAVSMFFVAVLLIPLLALTIRRLRGHALAQAHVPPIKLWQVIVLVIAWVVVIAISALVTGLPSGWVVALPFFLLGIILPVIVFLWIAIGGVPTGSWRRLWVALGLGMTLSPLIAIGLELLSVVAGAAVGGIIATFDPSLRASLEQLRNQVTGATNPQDLLPLIEPYLNNPWLLLVVLLFVSGIGPLIEEAFKPLAVWLMGKRLHSPGEGFALGALCGAGFAILEGMLVSSGAVDMVGVSVAARSTSTLMHITASAFMGWAIASAILQKRYGRLILIYFLSVGIHSLWNAAVVFTVYGGLRIGNPPRLELLGGVAIALGVGLLVILVIAILISLPIINSRLRARPARSNDIIAPNLS